MKFFVYLYFGLFSCVLVAQRERFLAYPETDSLYREDQFYVSATFHLINQRPANVEQSGFSGGVHFGFIRDIPFNKRRNWALGVGIGYSLNVYNHNLILSQDPTTGKTLFRLSTTDDALTNNRFRNQLLEFPIELRWRTSTPENYKFWRIYSGVRLGYMHSFSYQSENESGERIRLRKPDGLDRFRLGTSLTFGFNTFNFTVYYSVNPFFDNSVVITDSQGGLSTLKIGLLFYIL